VDRRIPPSALSKPSGDGGDALATIGSPALPCSRFQTRRVILPPSGTSPQLIAQANPNERATRPVTRSLGLTPVFRTEVASAIALRPSWPGPLSSQPTANIAANSSNIPRYARRCTGPIVFANREKECVSWQAK